MVRANYVWPDIRIALESPVVPKIRIIEILDFHAAIPVN
jgi:hypothetical protein